MSAENLDLDEINFQDLLRSKPVRNNFTDIQIEFNALNNQVNASLAATASEVTAARDNLTYLKDNIHERRIYGSGISTGAEVTTQGNNTFRLTAGKGITPDGRGLDFSGGTIGTVSAVNNKRYIIMTANADDTVSLELGATADHPNLPDILDSQRALMGAFQSTASPAVFSTSDIWDARRQGCISNGKYFFKIQDAVSHLTNTNGGVISVGGGKYYEEVDLTNKNNIHIKLSPDAKLYREDNLKNIFKCDNTASSITDSVKIQGGQFYGNSQTGAKELVNLSYIKNFTWENSFLNAGDATQATYPEFKLDNISTFVLSNLIYNDALTNISNSTKYTQIDNNNVITDGFSVYDDMLRYNKSGGF